MKLFGFTEPYAVIFPDHRYGIRKDVKFFGFTMDTFLLCWYPLIKEAGWLPNPKILDRNRVRFESENEAWIAYSKSSQKDSELGQPLHYYDIR